MTALERIVETSRRIAGRASRLAKIELLSQLFQDLAPDEIPIAVAMLTSTIRQGKIGVGYATLERAQPEGFTEEASLTLHDVDEALSEIRDISGKGSTARRKELLSALFSQCTEAEASFLFRLLIGELRQGALAGVMLDAVARATDLPLPALRRAAMFAGEVPVVAQAVLLRGEEALADFDLELFRPLQPMLAQPTESAAEALSEISGEPPLRLEQKLDGARVQVHRDGDEVRIYSRQLREVTPALPEIVEVVRRLPCRRTLLDGEAMTFDAQGRPNPFQVTMRRFGRRLEVDKLRQRLPIHVHFFDCLLIDDEVLIDAPGHERWRRLESLVAAAQRVRSAEASDAPDIQAFLEQALAAGHEGIMVKDPAAPYQAGGRGRAWLKVKPVHTLDLVVLAAEWGHGRRRGKLSNLHLGARDPKRVSGSEWAMLGKTFKGLTDELLEWQTRELLAREVRREGHVVFVRPELVVEIAFNDVQSSPHYPSGLALRFARVRHYRDDKSAGDADDIESVRALLPTALS